ncbi:glycosyltransferase family 2 protein [Salinicoccus kekensis]|uniref:Glycosyltransferase involved in cell wall bisynthesis n=1 Tax=Salinicoccus kekensis TaxID=714307 RepID=A0A285UVH0_9STAP|nr:glycosyltransferase family 2 protein [Salinicoccus kekensis]SOC44716.1 glycosyltransferase involved in cell wall bisynthesis [Salinicoccus kekensis]
MISICTPTFNRGYTLNRVYCSLVRQEHEDFEWIIVDDGSTDNTKELVEEFKKENKFPIKYIYQENQGKHIALNKGQDIATKKLFMCLDSDDWLAPNALEQISAYYERVMNNQKLCGIIFTDQNDKGEILGTELPHQEIKNWIDLIYRDKIKGDKCFIFKTDIIQEHPFITFKNNKHMPPTYQHYILSQDYDFYCINEPIKIVEYLPDGISFNIRSKYFNAPENYTYYRKMIHNMIPKLHLKLKNSIHYNITKIMSKNHPQLEADSCSQRLQNILMFPIGYIAFYLLKKKKNGGRSI